MEIGAGKVSRYLNSGGFEMKSWVLILGLLTWVNFSQAKEILVVVHGGFISCPRASVLKPLPPLSMYFYDHVSALEDSLRKTGNRVHSVTACFGNSTPPKEDALFVSSRSPGKLQNGNAAALKTEIETFHDTYADLKVVLVGHSYGGWTVMHLTQELDPKVKIEGLFTIDPISPLCGSEGGNYCHNAPQEFNNLNLRARVLSWVNLFQRGDAWIKSSKITEATNHDFDYVFFPHTQIANDPRVWEVITATLGVDSPL